MRRIDVLYLALGVGIIVRGTFDHGLTVQELGAAMFLIGLVPATKADRHHKQRVSPEIERKVVDWLSR